MEQQAIEDIIPQIRKGFYAMRNGMIADTLRKGGLEQKYIFGLQLPQIKEIAERYRPDNPEDAAQMARTLWSDRDCREARLLSCHLMPPTLMEEQEANEWTSSVATREEADILAFRLLRYLPYASRLAETLGSSEDSLKRYTASAIKRFL